MTEPWLLPFIEHGGCLRKAAAHYHIPLQQWTDLSTGINPQGWPVGEIPRDIWGRLPEEDDGLDEVMSHYFKASSVLAVAGSQSAIQALPCLRPPGRVAVRVPSYGEHARAWQKAGHTVIPTDATEDEIEPLLDAVDVLVVVNPNNPTGKCVSPTRLLRWHDRISRHHGWLVVDEAFADACPESSVAAHASKNLIVLRSFGKFWGLAGVRLGFALAAQELLANLRAHLGPWHVSNPARWIARIALADQTWMHAARARLHQESERLATMLADRGLASPAGCPLFRWVPTPNVVRMFDAFARRSILIRAFPQFGGVRLGLPESEPAWRKLGAALDDVMAEMRA